MIIGVDIDGVLANFTDAYAALLTAKTGIEFPKNSSSWPTEWYWERAAGVNKADETAVWKDGILSTNFWANLPRLPLAEQTLDLLMLKRWEGDQVYFITTRPGKKAKLLTEAWLQRWGFLTPTVLIAGSEAAKGQLAKALKLDVFIDDKPENCEQVIEATKQQVAYDGMMSMEPFYEYPCKVFLVDAPYNRTPQPAGIIRVSSALDALNYQESVLNVAA